MTTNGQINIVFSSDRNFIPYFATSLCSVLKNYADDRALHVYLLTDEFFTQEDRETILRMRSVRDFEFHVISVDPSKYRSIKTTVGITAAAYNRLYMDAILPLDVERAIYLDSDLIVEKNIAEIYDLPMEGLLFRGVEDSISSVYKSRYDLPMQSHHINSGVMLCNIGLMRKIHFDNKINDFLSIHRYRVVMGDQQIINEVFHAMIGELPVAWNVHGSMFLKGWIQEKVGSDNSMNASEVAEAVSSPAIIHYTFKRKPWMSLDHPRARTWHRYNERTPYRIGLPAGTKPTRKAAPTKKPPLRKRVFKTLDRMGGFFKSIYMLRLTRIEVKDLRKVVGGVSKMRPPTAPTIDTSIGEKAREALLKTILSDLGSRRKSAPFIARSFVETLQEGGPVLCNAQQKDLDGGFNENLKTILRTSDISRNNTTNSQFAMILVHRVQTPEFWQCINTALFYNVPLVFVEMNYFAAFSTYFDKTANPAERRCLGFIVDDMGSYFDARQPSRIETTLNDPSYLLTTEEVKRARVLISTIQERRLTKYNKYVPNEPVASDVETDAIVVIDQKRGDASIDFARADNTSFDRMLSAAINENPGRTIYLKAHPDNLHRGAGSQSAIRHPRIKIIADEISAPDLMDLAGTVYVVSSQMGFEALLRGKRVITFGLPFYAGWGLTEDRCSVPRRTTKRTIEDVFHVTCIRQSVYINPHTGKLVEMEEMFDLIEGMKQRFMPNAPMLQLAAE